MREFHDLKRGGLENSARANCILHKGKTERREGQQSGVSPRAEFSLQVICHFVNFCLALGWKPVISY